MNFNRAQVTQGRLNSAASEETPGSFGEVNGADQVSATKDLAKSQNRMAGQMGARAQALMSDPNEQQRVASWMQQFGMSNQGFEYNQAKMNQGMMPAPGMPPQGA